jgi:hypothetical protein
LEEKRFCLRGSESDVYLFFEPVGLDFCRTDEVFLRKNKSSVFKKKGER